MKFYTDNTVDNGYVKIERSRIEPEEGSFRENEVGHYIDELSFLKENGIKTFVTLVHFTVPYWFEKKGGFTKLENLKYFERYLNYLLPKISEYVDFWNVINEFNLGSSQEKLDYKFNSVFYHARGYRLIKQFSDKPVSSAHALVQYYELRNDKFNDDFHVFGINWTKKFLEFYVDNVIFSRWHIEDTPELHIPHFVLLNLAVGGGWPGAPDETTVFPQEYIVDWIRYYKGGEHE